MLEITWSTIVQKLCTRGTFANFEYVTSDWLLHAGSVRGVYECLLMSWKQTDYILKWCYHGLSYDGILIHRKSYISLHKNLKTIHYFERNKVLYIIVNWG